MIVDGAAHVPAPQLALPRAEERLRARAELLQHAPVHLRRGAVVPEVEDAALHLLEAGEVWLIVGDVEGGHPLGGVVGEHVASRGHVGPAADEAGQVPHQELDQVHLIVAEVTIIISDN